MLITKSIKDLYKKLEKKIADKNVAEEDRKELKRFYEALMKIEEECED